jgi:hypothetical protein
VALPGREAVTADGGEGRVVVARRGAPVAGRAP